MRGVPAPSRAWGQWLSQSWTVTDLGRGELWCVIRLALSSVCSYEGFYVRAKQLPSTLMLDHLLIWQMFIGHLYFPVAVLTSDTKVWRWMVVMVTHTGNVFNTTKMFFYIWWDGHFYVMYILTQLKKKGERQQKKTRSLLPGSSWCPAPPPSMPQLWSGAWTMEVRGHPHGGQDETSGGQDFPGQAEDGPSGRGHFCMPNKWGIYAIEGAGFKHIAS